MSGDEHEVLTYEQFGVAARALAQQVADTGQNLEHVRKFFAGHVAQAWIAVIYQKARSIVRPDYAWREPDRWIDFAVSVEPPIANRTRGQES